MNITRKRKAQEGHKRHLKKVMKDVTNIMSQYGNDYVADLLPKKPYLERKSILISQFVNKTLEMSDNEGMINGHI